MFDKEMLQHDQRPVSYVRDAPLSGIELIGHACRWGALGGPAEDKGGLHAGGNLLLPGWRLLSLTCCTCFKTAAKVSATGSSSPGPFSPPPPRSRDGRRGGS